MRVVDICLLVLCGISFVVIMVWVLKNAPSVDEFEDEDLP